MVADDLADPTATDPMGSSGSSGGSGAGGNAGVVYDSGDEQSTIGSLNTNRLRIELIGLQLTRESRSLSSSTVTSATGDFKQPPPPPTPSTGGAEQQPDDQDDQIDDDDEPVEVDGGYGWAVAFGAFLANFFVSGTVKSYGLLNISVLETFNCSAAQSATVIGLLITTSLLVSPLVGALCERFTCRVVVICGGLLCFAGFSLAALATTVTQLCLTVGLLAGLGAGCTTTPGILIATRYFPGRRSMVNGIVLAGNSAGSFALPPLFEFLLDAYGLRGTLLLIGVLCLHVVVGGALFRPVHVHRAVLHRRRQRRREMERRQPFIDDMESGVDSQERAVLAAGSCERAVVTAHLAPPLPALSSSLACVPVTVRGSEDCVLRPSSRASVVDKASLYSVPTARRCSASPLKTATTRSLPRLLDIVRQRTLPLAQFYQLDGSTGTGGSRSGAEAATTTAAGAGKAVTLAGRRALLATRELRGSSLMVSTNDVTADATSQFTDDIKMLRREQHQHVTGQSVTVSPLTSPAPPTVPSSMFSSTLWRRMCVVFDLPLLGNRLFMLLTTSVFFMAVGSPYSLVQLPVFVVQHGLTRRDAVRILSVVSAVDLASRLTLGWLFDRPAFPRHHAFAVSQLVAGVALALLPCASQLPAVVALCVCFTMGMSAWYVNLVPVLADHHGIERVVAAYSLVRMFYGLCTLVAPPLLGLMVDINGDYSTQYYVMGACSLVAGTLCCVIIASGLDKQRDECDAVGKPSSPPPPLSRAVASPPSPPPTSCPLPAKDEAM